LATTFALVMKLERKWIAGTCRGESNRTWKNKIPERLGQREQIMQPIRPEGHPSGG